MTTLLTGVNGGTFPNTATGPAAGELITASSVNTPVQAVLNECKYLYDTKGALAVANTWTAKQTFDLAAPGTGLETATDTTADFNGPVVCDGTLTCNSTTTINGTFAATAAAFLNGTTTINGATEATDDFEISGTAYLSGLTRYRDVQYPADADATLSTASGDVYALAVPGAVRTYKLQTTTAPVPLQGERLLIVSPPGAGAGLNFHIQREDGTLIMDLYDPGSWVLCQFTGTVWRGVCYSGVNNVAGGGY